MDWKQEVLKRLDALAEKLGTTAAYLWTVLMKQALSEGVADLIWGIVWSVIAIVVYKVAMLAWKHAKDENDGEFFFGAVVIYFICGGVTCVAVSFITDSIQHFINPAYYALHEILEAVTK